MMQIFDDDYVTLIPFSRSFEYIFPHCILAIHLQLTEYCSSTLTQLPTYIYCVNGQYVYAIKDLPSQGGEHTFILKIMKHLIFPFLTGYVDASIYVFR